MRRPRGLCARGSLGAAPNAVLGPERQVEFVDAYPAVACSVPGLSPKGHRWFWVLKDVQNVAQIIESVLDAVPKAVLLVNVHGALLFLNRAAHRALPMSPTLMHLHGNTIGRLGHLEGPEWLATLDRVKHGHPHATTIRWPRGTAMVESRVHFAVFAPVAADMPYAGSILIVVDTIDPVATTASKLSEFCLRHGIAPAEQALLVLMLEGHSVVKAAELRGTSINTARTLVRRILLRTGHRRLIDLVREVSRAP